jgi:hypothetical protein
MKVYRCVEAQFRVFINLRYMQGEWPVSCFGRLTSNETSACTQLIGGWKDPGHIVDTVVKEIFLRPNRVFYLMALHSS